MKIFKEGVMSLKKIIIAFVVVIASGCQSSFNVSDMENSHLDEDVIKVDDNDSDYDDSDDISSVSVCGNELIEEGEVCDSREKACSTLGIGTSGFAECRDDCSGWITEEVCKNEFICSEKPDNTIWNTVSNYNQVWNGSGWDPENSETHYDKSESETECRFRCASCFEWNGSECVSLFQMVRQWGTGEQDRGGGIAVDDAGNIFMLGETYGVFDGTENAGHDDIFLTKWDKKGNKEWTKQWGTEEYDKGYDIKIDPIGNVFVVGYTSGSFPENENIGFDDVFLTKLNNDGEIQWTKQFGSTREDRGLSLAIDVSGNVYVTGYIKDYQPKVFLTKLTNEGAEVWTGQWGDGQYYGNSVVIDISGNIFIAGGFLGVGNAGGYDAFLIKINPEGVLEWKQEWGTAVDDEGQSVDIDSSGNIYVAGGTKGDLHGYVNAGDQRDAFLTKWSDDGKREWTRQWGAENNDIALAIVVSGSGEIFVAGETTNPLDGNVAAGSEDIFLTKWMSDGQKVWTKQFGSEYSERCSSITADEENNLYITGHTGGSLEEDKRFGSSDVFFVKVDSD